MYLNEANENKVPKLLIDDFKGFEKFLAILYRELHCPLVKCKKDFTLSTKVLTENFADYQLGPLLKYFRNEDIHCDCEVLNILKSEYYY